MKKKHAILIAGAGGIGQALALILAEYSDVPPTFYLGDQSVEKAIEAAGWIREGATRHLDIIPFHLPEYGDNAAIVEALQRCNILLDCLPGSQAPRMAHMALEYGLHYVNLTEYVQETQEIMAMAARAHTGFVLQTGLAPGFVGVLAHGMFLEFCAKYGVDKADYIGMKVGALTLHAPAPYFYGFTWSPIGVATEYVKDAQCIRNFQKVSAPALSEPEIILIHGMPYEADLTSGGAADLPEALQGKVRDLDYKTLRYPGHYDWVKQVLASTPEDGDPIAHLQRIMLETIPHVEDDCVVIHACVQGKDAEGTLRKTEQAYKIFPQQVGRHTLRAIQVATAAPMAECARMLLEEPGHQGVILQSRIDAVSFLNGTFIQPFYRKAVRQEAELLPERSIF